MINVIFILACFILHNVYYLKTKLIQRFLKIPTPKPQTNQQIFKRTNNS